MGVNSKGDLEVPAGSTADIGWYAKGTVPGDKGSAVMDAHVFAGFSHLDKVAAGDGIDVAMADGTTRRFIVTATKTFALADLTPQELYSQDDGRYLHLITCAGTLTPDHSTYTQRLVVYAALAK
jgi:sortase (surface protein transpeptidase)